MSNTSKFTPEWDEAHLVEGLAHMNELFVKARELRATIPRMIQPFLVQEERTPEDFFNTFKNAATKAVEDVRSFQSDMQSEETRKVLDYTAKSRSRSKAVPPYCLVDHSDWYSHEPLKVDTVHVDVVNEEDKTITTKGEKSFVLGDVDDIVKDFQKAHGDVKLHYDSETKIIKLRILTGTRILFTIRIAADDDVNTRLSVDMGGTSQLKASILRCVASRLQPNDLRLLLEMLASYKDIMSKPCARCGKVLSETAQFPSARRLLDGVDVDSGAGQDWLALHEECVQAKS